MRMTVLNQHLVDFAKGLLLPVPSWLTTLRLLKEYNCKDLEQHCTSCADKAACHKRFALCRQEGRPVTSSRP